MDPAITRSGSRQSDHHPLLPQQSVTAFGCFLFSAPAAVVTRRYGYKPGSTELRNNNEQT